MSHYKILYFCTYVTTYLISATNNRGQNRNQLHVLCEVSYSKQSFKLLEGHKGGYSSHEPKQSCLWQKIKYET